MCPSCFSVCLRARMCEAHNEFKHIHTNTYDSNSRNTRKIALYCTRLLRECVFVCARGLTKRLFKHVILNGFIFIVWNDTEYEILALAYSFIMFCVKCNVHILSEKRYERDGSVRMEIISVKVPARSFGCEHKKNFFEREQDCDKCVFVRVQRFVTDYNDEMGMFWFTCVALRQLGIIFYSLLRLLSIDNLANIFHSLNAFSIHFWH